MSTDQDLMTAITAERRAIADVLAGLTPAQWDSPSLCKGWRIREVAAHLLMPYRYSLWQVAKGVVGSRGRFDVMADRFAHRDAARLSPEEMVSILRDNAETRWKPPGGGFLGALSHDVIHGLDMTVPLGLDRVVPLDRVSTVLQGLSPRQLRFFRVNLVGVELQATDLDWSYGSGAQVSGLAQDLLLVVSGRTLPPGRLQGEQSRRFAAA
jgi:uncharacterized protein (TIGR03083 family)